jgi:hypothetical protein
MDLCIGALFSNLEKNIQRRTATVPATELVPGMYLSAISYRDTMQFERCYITSVEQDKTIGGIGNFVLITFTYETKYMNNEPIDPDGQVKIFSKYVSTKRSSGWQFRR